MGKRGWTKCAECGADIYRLLWNYQRDRPMERSFCDTTCKGNWQRENLKPEGVTREWLVQKYQVEQFDCAEIGRFLGRDTKRVWEWLKDYGIEIRGRGTSTSKQWARGERKAHGKPHTPESKEKIRQARLKDGRVPYLMPDGSHYMKGRRGADHHSWQGGLTPERAKLAHTDEWKSAVKFVWARADAKCERCSKDHRAVDNRKKDGFHVHHIIPWRYREYRCRTDNLVLLCRPCHHWVHSRKNKDGEYIAKPDNGSGGHS